LPHLLLGDAAHVLQVLYNLIDNAVKFTFSGSVSIAATRLPVFHTGIVWVLFTVSDTGIGIPSSKLSDLFKPFPQTEGSYIRHNKGAGLGLPIVKRLVCLMNGTIAVASEESAGTTFYVSIPFRHATTTPETTTDVNVVQAPPAPAVCRVLVVEDDEVSQQIVTQQLLMAGYAVKVADNLGRSPKLTHLCLQELTLWLRRG